MTHLRAVDPDDPGTWTNGSEWSMRFDHVSFAAGPSGLAATVADLSELLGVEFHDGGAHPRFGTRNMILPLRNQQYVEVVEVLDHPAADKAAFGQVVRQRSEAGGGWMGWCVSVDDMTDVEHRIGRHSVPANRRRPDGFNLEWRQIGTSGMKADPQLPYVTKWDVPPEEHPSQVAPSDVTLTALQMAGSPKRLSDWLGEPAVTALEGIAVEWVAPHGLPGIMKVSFDTPRGPVEI